MKIFEIWMEGYAATGESGTAQCLGEFEGETFDDAVEAYNRSVSDDGNKAKRNMRSKYISDEAYEDRYSDWSIWACNLYNHEADARKAFG